MKKPKNKSSSVDFLSLEKQRPLSSRWALLDDYHDETLVGEDFDGEDFDEDSDGEDSDEDSDGEKKHENERKESAVELSDWVLAELVHLPLSLVAMTGPWMTSYCFFLHSLLLLLLLLAGVNWQKMMMSVMHERDDDDDQHQKS